VEKITAEILRQEDLTEQDAEKFCEWVYAMRDKNNFDPGVMWYPRTIMCRAQAGEEPIAYVPLQPVLMYESLAAKPGVSSRQLAMALWKISEAVDKAARVTSFCEAFLITSDENEATVASLHGWKIIMHDPERKTWLLKHRVKKEISEPQIAAPTVTKQ
jgi:hypothetical protein